MSDAPSRIDPRVEQLPGDPSSGTAKECATCGYRWYWRDYGAYGWGWAMLESGPARMCEACSTMPDDPP